MSLTRMSSAVSVACLLAVLVPSSARGGDPSVGPAPTEQPFGPAPTNIGRYDNGEVLDSRPVDANILGVPLPATGWQVQYKSIDNHGDPNVYITTVLVPRTAWTGAGPRPLVSYQVAEDGVAYKCAPSWALSGGGLAATNGGEPPAILISALLRGWTVTVPDYEGPASEFLGAEGSAHGVLDGIRATRAFAPAGVDGNAPVGLWGYSGGALASSLAAMSQPTYAPDVPLAGVALGGTPASLEATLRSFSAIPGLSSALNVGLVGLDRSYPERKIKQYLNDAGRAGMRRAANDCVYSGVLRTPLASIAAYGMTDREIGTMFAGIDPLQFPGRPQAPVLMYHSILDELAPIAPARRLAKKYCNQGVRLKKVEGILGEHVVYAATAWPIAVRYLADRFAGRPAPTSC